MKRESYLTNWKVQFRASADCYIMTGDVLNDDRFPDGKTIFTSMLERVDYLKMTAETKNTIYHLIGPDRGR